MKTLIYLAAVFFLLIKINNVFSQTYTRPSGKKFYEMKDHLGNVSAVVSDKKNPLNVNDLAAGATASVESYSNYYPYGMEQPGRNFSSPDYRYGYNGKEKDNELKGEGNSYDYGARIYDPRNARWLAIDPLAIKYPGLSPYNYVANNPINAVDADGRDIVLATSNPTIKEGLAILKATKTGKELLSKYDHNPSRNIYITDEMLSLFTLGSNTNYDWQIPGEEIDLESEFENTSKIKKFLSQKYPGIDFSTAPVPLMVSIVEVNNLFIAKHSRYWRLALNPFNKMSWLPSKYLAAAVIYHEIKGHIEIYEENARSGKQNTNHSDDEHKKLGYPLGSTFLFSLMGYSHGSPGARNESELWELSLKEVFDKPAFDKQTQRRNDRLDLKYRNTTEF